MQMIALFNESLHLPGELNHMAATTVSINRNVISLAALLLAA